MNPAGTAAPPAPTIRSRIARRLRTALFTGALASTFVVVQVAVAAVEVTCDPQSPNIGATTTCTAKATAPGGTPDKYTFSFEGEATRGPQDGNTASATFGSAGNKAVSVLVTYAATDPVTDPTAPSDDTGKTTVNVVQPNRNPTVSPISCSPSSCAVTSGETISFSAPATDADGDTLAYSWSFGSGARCTGESGSSPTCSYPTGGSRVVNVVVSDGRGGTQTRSVMVNVANRPPVGDYAFSPNPFGTGATVTFTARFTDPDGPATALRYRWDLDGSSANGFEVNTGSTPTASRSFPLVKPYTVGVEVRDSNGSGRVGTFSSQVTPGNTQPVASFNYSPNPIVARQAATFTSTSVDLDGGGISSYAWEFDGDGDFDDATTAVASYTFPTVGSHAVSLRVRDGLGSAAALTQTVAVVSAPPAAALSARPSAASPPAALARPTMRILRPFPVVRLRGTLTRRGARIRLLAVQAPKGARAVVRCKGRSCGKRSQRLTVRGVRSLRFKRFHRHLRAGTVLEVFVTKPGTIGKYVRFTIRKRKAPVRKDSCVVSASRAPSRCPRG